MIDNYQKEITPKNAINKQLNINASTKLNKAHNECEQEVHLKERKKFKKKRVLRSEPNPRLQLTAKVSSANLEMRFRLFG